MQRILLLAVVAATLLGALVVIEFLKNDEPFTWPMFWLDFAEKLLLALAVAATAVVALDLRSLRRERGDLIDAIARARAEGEHWRARARQHVDGLSRAIADQFAAWHLTEGERDVASLLLKGLSHKDIARLRDTGEQTVRQQAAAVYRKSGLGTRAELAAFFLEDLLAPSPVRGTGLSLVSGEPPR